MMITNRAFRRLLFFMEETSEYGERELKHSDGEAERFYRGLQQRGIRQHYMFGQIRDDRLYDPQFHQRLHEC